MSWKTICETLAIAFVLVILLGCAKVAIKNYVRSVAREVVQERLGK